MFFPPPPPRDNQEPAAQNVPQVSRDPVTYGAALKRSGATPEETVEALLDFGVDEAEALEIVNDLFPRRFRPATTQPLKEKALDGIKDLVGYKDCIGYNKAGFVLILLSFGLALFVCWLSGDTRNERVLTIGGPVATVLDLCYRRYTAGPHWLRPDQGGRFLLVPVWIFGFIWLAIGMGGGLSPRK